MVKICCFYFSQFFPTLRQIEDMNHINFRSLAGTGLYFILSSGNNIFKDL
jgi:hypothetical protein